MHPLSLSLCRLWYSRLILSRGGVFDILSPDWTDSTRREEVDEGTGGRGGKEEVGGGVTPGQRCGSRRRSPTLITNTCVV